MIQTPLTILAATLCTGGTLVWTGNRAPAEPVPETVEINVGLACEHTCDTEPDKPCLACELEAEDRLTLFETTDADLEREVEDALARYEQQLARLEAELEATHGRRERELEQLERELEARQEREWAELDRLFEQDAQAVEREWEDLERWERQWESQWEDRFDELEDVWECEEAAPCEELAPECETPEGGETDPVTLLRRGDREAFAAELARAQAGAVRAGALAQARAIDSQVLEAMARQEVEAAEGVRAARSVVRVDPEKGLLLGFDGEGNGPHLFGELAEHLPHGIRLSSDDGELRIVTPDGVHVVDLKKEGLTGGGVVVLSEERDADGARRFTVRSSMGLHGDPGKAPRVLRFSPEGEHGRIRFQSSEGDPFVVRTAPKAPFAPRKAKGFWRSEEGETPFWTSAAPQPPVPAVPPALPGIRVTRGDAGIARDLDELEGLLRDMRREMESLRDELRDLRGELRGTLR